MMTCITSLASAQECPVAQADFKPFGWAAYTARILEITSPAGSRVNWENLAHPELEQLFPGAVSSIPEAANLDLQAFRIPTSSLAGLIQTIKGHTRVSSSDVFQLGSPVGLSSGSKRRWTTTYLASELKFKDAKQSPQVNFKTEDAFLDIQLGMTAGKLKPAFKWQPDSYAEMTRIDLSWREVREWTQAKSEDDESVLSTTSPVSALAKASYCVNLEPGKSLVLTGIGAQAVQAAKPGGSTSEAGSKQVVLILSATEFERR